MTPEQIAEDVARRYGIPVAPDAVKIIPQGQMASGREYRWDGHQLKDVTGTTAKDSMRAAINARWRQHEHAKRLARAKKAEEPPKPHPSVIKAEQRLATVKAMIRDGAKLDGIAAFLGTSEKSARQYCHRHKIAPPLKKRSKAEDAKRLARVRKFAANGDKTMKEIAAFLGVKAEYISPYIYRHGIPYAYEKKRAA